MPAVELKQRLHNYFLFTLQIFYNYWCTYRGDCSIRVFQSQIQRAEKWPAGPWALPQSLLRYCSNFIICIPESHSYALLSTDTLKTAVHIDTFDWEL